jgi:xanthine dehydrogenase YagR molybdenum-binding subunit
MSAEARASVGQSLDDLDVSAGIGLQERSARASEAVGAHFAEMWVDSTTGEVRVPRLVGVFAADRIVNSTSAA